MELMKPGTPNGNDEQHEIEATAGLTQPDAASGSADAPVGSTGAEETALNQPPVPPTQEGESGEPNEQDGGEDVRHHLTYMAQGIWKDAEGQHWHREDGKKGCISHKVMPESKLKSRPDLQFMIRYGAIKDVIVK